MADLFGGSGSEGEGAGPALRTENEYARRYDAWREREELHKLEQKYGENPSEAALSGSSDSEEDDEPLEVSEKLEKDFLKTLSLLKKRDPRIYDPNYKFFEKKEETEEQKIETEIEEKPKPKIRSLAQAFGDSDDESDGDIFTVEKKSEEPEIKEDKLKEFLTGKVEHLGDESEKDLEALKALWSDPKLNEGEAFLRDYILNKKYLDDDDEAGEDAGVSGKLLDDDDLEADEKTVEEQGKFERAYNFRFEEPDQDYLKRYPRTVSSIRPKDDRRARKRAEVRTRKEEEKRRKMEEIARMKALKLKEIQEKIAKIKEVTGNQDLAFKDEDIEGDFDPELHDKRMQAIFDAQYYNDLDTEKPVFPDLDEELEIENWDKIYEEEISGKSGSRSKVDGHCEDEDFNMDAEYDPAKARTTLMEEIQETLGKKRRNRKRKNKLAQILAKEKPKFDPTTADRTYAEYMEEYYKMDCEDVIGGDLPTRFKYRDVVPNSYGLSIEEILLADDKELNKWVPLKKTVKYRPDHVEKSEVKTYQQKAMDVELKKKIIPSLFNEIEEPQPPVEPKAKRKKNKKKKNKPKEKENGNEVILEPSTSTEVNAGPNLSKNDIQEDNAVKKSKNNEIQQFAVTTTVITETVDNESQVNQDTPKKKKRKNKTNSDNVIRNSDNVIRNSDKNMQSETNSKINSNVISSNVITTETGKKKRKKKNKKEQNNQNEPTTLVKVNENIKKNKRKLPTDSNTNAKKIKFNDKNKQKAQKDTSSENPMTKLSDERLKAYGLNPKKYRSFLKYKKF